jgi:hypothetical protein
MNRFFGINRFGIGPLHNLSSLSNFDFEFAEIFVIDKLESRRLPVSLSWGVVDSPYRLVEESAIEFLKENSLYRRVVVDSPNR